MVLLPVAAVVAVALFLPQEARWRLDRVTGSVVFEGETYVPGDLDRRQMIRLFNLELFHRIFFVEGAGEGEALRKALLVGVPLDRTFRLQTLLDTGES